MFSELQIGNPGYAFLALVAVLAIVLIVGSALLKRVTMKKFASAALWSRTTSPRTTAQAARGIFRGLALVSCILLLAAALMDLRWGKTSRKVPQKGIQVIFALDVSRSMLAEDVSPNRLERAKQQIKDMITEMAGDRVGLVVFAGEADQAIPLTNHYDDFAQILDTVGPDSVSRGGSSLGAAIQAASDGFIGKSNDHKTIVLITDGEDQESNPVELARQLHASDNTRIFTVGLGDIQQGALIPETNSRGPRFVQHNGQQVRSKLNGKILRAIATETDAAYIPAGVKQANMADVYHRYVADVEQTEFGEAKIKTFIPRFQWFALPALLMLLGEVVLQTWPTPNRTPAKSQLNATAKRDSGIAADILSNETIDRSSKIKPAKMGAAVLALCLFHAAFSAESIQAKSFLPQTAVSQSSTSKTDQTTGQTTGQQINAANQLLHENKIAQAIQALSEIETQPDDPFHDRVQYNLAVAHYRNSDFAAAETLFGSTASANETRIAADSRYNRGNCLYSKALPLVQPKTPDANTANGIGNKGNPDPAAIASAIGHLQSAVANYRSSLRLDRSNADARANLELAMKLIQQLKDQQDEQKEQEQQDQQNQQQNDQQNDQDQQENNKDSNQNKPDSGNESENENPESDQSKDPNDEGEKNRDSKNDSDNGKPDSQQQNNDDKKNGSDSNQQKSQNENQGQNQNQSDNSKNGDPSKPQPQQGSKQDDPSADDDAKQQESKSKDEPTPDGQLKAADAQKNPQDPNAKSGVTQSGTEAVEGNPEGNPRYLTREEALKMLQAVRDRDLLRRLRKRQQQRTRRVPVEKDW